MGRQAREFSMPETWARRWQGVAKLLVGAQIGVESNSSQRDDHFHVAERSQLVQQIRLTVCDFLTVRFIAGRNAVDHLRDVAIVEGETVLTMGGIWLVCEAEPM